MKGHPENAADPGRSECEAAIRGENNQTPQIIVDRGASSSDWDLIMVCNLLDNHYLKRAEKRKRDLEGGVISHVVAKWCCRCRVMTSFLEKKCVTPYCEHRRCPRCRNFNRGGEGEKGQRMRRGEWSEMIHMVNDIF